MALHVNGETISNKVSNEVSNEVFEEVRLIETVNQTRVPGVDKALLKELLIQERSHAGGLLRIPPGPLKSATLTALSMSSGLSTLVLCATTEDTYKWQRGSLVSLAVLDKRVSSIRKDDYDRVIVDNFHTLTPKQATLIERFSVRIRWAISGYPRLCGSEKVFRSVVSWAGFGHLTNEDCLLKFIIPFQCISSSRAREEVIVIEQPSSHCKNGKITNTDAKVRTLLPVEGTEILTQLKTVARRFSNMGVMTVNEFLNREFRVKTSIVVLLEPIICPKIVDAIANKCNVIHVLVIAGSDDEKIVHVLDKNRWSLMKGFTFHSVKLGNQLLKTQTSPPLSML